MKRLILAFLLTLTAASIAQTTSLVPGFISYQGKVLNSTGGLVGAGTPVNRTVIFRVWDHPSNTLEANLVYSEQQTVTIADGEFSVLVGQGTATTISPFGFAESDKGPPTSAISNAFNGANRYLGVTVATGAAIAITDNEITPRQQIVSSAFAFRSKFAEMVSSGTDLQLNGSANYGLGYYGGARLFNGTAIDGPVLYGNGGGALGSFNGAAQTTALRWNASGQVGIGSASWTTGAATTAKLVLQGDDAGAPPQQLNIRGNSDTNKRLLVGYNTTSNYGTLQSYSAASTTSNLLLNPVGGNVGIGTTAAPTQALDVTGNGRFTGTVTATGFTGSGTVTAASFSGSGTGLTGIPKLAEANNFALPQTFTDNDVNTPQLFTIVRNPGNLPGSGTSGTLSMCGERFGIYGGGADGDAVIRSNRSIIISSLPSNTFNPTTRGIVVNTSNNVGIGTATPRAKLEVSGSTGTANIPGGYRLFNGGTTTFTGGNISGWGLFCTNDIAGSSIYAFSDERIKRISGRSDAARDLTTLMNIEVTDYSFIDVVAKGTGEQKKVIAQQVEKIYPQAVKLLTDVIPDIFKNADVKDGWVLLATDLKKGDRVRLIGDGKEGIHEVLEVSEGRFRTDFAPDAGGVFVYGREVKDFRTVDYEAIGMLNVSATQQIKKELDSEVKTLREENSELRTRVAALEAKDKARDAKMASIEKLLESSDQPATRTISLKAE